MTKAGDYLDALLRYVHRVDMFKISNPDGRSLLIIKNGEGKATFMQRRPKLFTLHVSPFTAF